MAVCLKPAAFAERTILEAHGMAISRRQTADVKVFKRSGPEAVVYDLSKTNCVTITLAIGSKWTSQPHWHETHTEFLQILQGRAFVRLGNRDRKSVV